MFFIRRAFSWVVLIWIGLLVPSSAHVVQQLFAEVIRGGPDWQVEVLFDAGYADPESRGDPDTPQPTRDWLAGLPLAEQRAICEQGAAYLGECLEFTDSSGVVETRVHFVDFDKSPPDFPKLLTNGAYFRVLISPARAERTAAVHCKLRPGRHPDFVFKMPSEEDGDSGYLTLRPDESFVLWQGGDSHESRVAARAPLEHALREGFLHVLPYGLDHVLFVLGLFLLSRKWKPLLWQSLGFTCAHTLTLGLAAAGIIAPRSSWIEPLIALSIAFLAIENLFSSKLSPWRLPLVFAFGLVHGMGFATALSTLLTPGEGFLPRLIAANLGVEIAQVTILAAAWLLTTGWCDGPGYQRFRKWANLSLAVTALWWFVSRIS